MGSERKYSDEYTSAFQRMILPNQWQNLILIMHKTKEIGQVMYLPKICFSLIFYLS